MSVRAKFKVEERIEATYGGKVILSPVTGGCKENSRFFKMTPYGRFEMGTINEEVLKQFTPGKEFYIDFTEVE